MAALDLEALREAGQVYEAVLPLPTCVLESGCRSIIRNEGDDTIVFDLADQFNIATTVSFKLHKR